MKQFLVVFTLSILMTPALLSQKIAALDNNFGFKEYRFNMQKSQFNHEHFESVENGGAEKCSVTPKNQVGDIPVNDIELFFIDDKLAKIVVYFENNFNENLLYACRSAFGTPTGNKKLDKMLFDWKSDVIILEHYWDAQKVRLTHSYDRYNTSYPELKLIFALKDYQQLQERYKSQKYTSSDF